MSSFSPEEHLGKRGFVLTRESPTGLAHELQAAGAQVDDRGKAGLPSGIVFRDASSRRVPCFLHQVSVPRALQVSRFHKQDGKTGKMEM